MKEVPDGWSYYLYYLRKLFEIFTKQQQGESSVMVRTDFVPGDEVNVVYLSDLINALSYLKISC